jgi:WD40 repeat protein
MERRGEQEALLEGHTDWVTSVAFSHNGHFIVSGSKDETVRIWNAVTGETACLLLDHSGGVMSGAMSGDDKYVVSGSDTKVRIWEMATGTLACELMGPLDKVTSVAVSLDSRHIAAASYTELWIWDVGVMGHEVPSTATEINDSRVLHNTQFASSRPGPMTWRQAVGLNNSKMSVGFSPDGTQIVSGVGYGAQREAVHIWSVMTGRLMHILEGHSYPVTSVSCSPDGSHIASGSLDHTVRIWDARIHSGPQSQPETKVTRTLGWLSSEDECLTSCALSPDGGRLVIGSDKKAWVWNYIANTKECELRENMVRSVAFSNDGSHVVSGSGSGSIRIWNCHTENEIGLYRHSAEVLSVGFFFFFFFPSLMSFGAGPYVRHGLLISTSV